MTAGKWTRKLSFLKQNPYLINKNYFLFGFLRMFMGFWLKLVSAIFINFLFFQQMPFKNYEKCLLFHLKSSFCFWDIQIFVFLSFLLFLPVGHCFTGWSEINVEVHDVINCLNTNSITHFVWYLQKEKRYDIETLSIDGVSDKEHFYKKIMQKICSKS